MALLRILVLLALLGAALSFALYAWTGQLRYRLLGVRVLKGTIAVALVFFLVLVLDRWR